jgi:predicted acyl esterase
MTVVRPVSLDMRDGVRLVADHWSGDAGEAACVVCVVAHEFTGIGPQSAHPAHPQLWIEPAMAHAETATDDELVERIARWVRSAAAAPGSVVCDDDRRE